MRLPHAPSDRAPASPRRTPAAGGPTAPIRRRVGGLLLAAAMAAAPAAEAAVVQAGAGEARVGPDTTQALPSVEEKVRDMEAMEGFVDAYWDEEEGRIFLAFERWEEPFLYQISLASGLGSNPVGLDRGQLGATHLVVARRVGPRVLLVEENLKYRARGGTPAEREAVREAFAPSTIWGFEMVARTGDRVLVDATDFFLRDAHGVARQLADRGQGSYGLDRDRSTIHLPATRSFPRNLEVEGWLTFTSDDPGPLVRRAAASGEAVSLRQHHSFVRLPEAEGYRPRPVDPRVGAFSISFRDYATPIDQELEIRWATRHRLRAREPGAEGSPPVEPLVYHVDPGIPEPIRSAVIEGASWWEEAFESAGFEDAFRVEVLPEDADPMDLRYNVIHWTHRRTRGWSYGSSVVDPRTGEILKGNVNLGSLRLRQDWLLASGLRPLEEGGPEAGRRDGSGAYFESGTYLCELSAGPGFGYLGAVAQETSPTEMALARIRQLAAHEVGHTLGLAHNFIASTYGRASVMDYPAPLVRIRDDGGLDLSDAYDTGIGEYDRFAVNWLYRDVPDGADEDEVLEAIVRDGLDRGYRFISDADARPAGAAHPLAALWDNGSDPVRALRHEMEVRERGLAAFGPGSIREGEPLASLEEVLVPLYLHHRYQVEAAAHTLGGVDYSYALRGDGQTPRRRVAPEAQRDALDALLATLDPEFLEVPERILETIPPRAFGMADGEAFGKRTSPVFDPMGVAASSARFTLRFLLQPERLARLVEHHARDRRSPGPGEVARRLVEGTWEAPDPEEGSRRAVLETVRQVVLDELLAATEDARQVELARAEIAAEIRSLAGWLEARGEDRSAPEDAALRRIRAWEERGPEARSPARVPELPPGSPIGGGG